MVNNVNGFSVLLSGFVFYWLTLFIGQYVPDETASPDARHSGMQPFTGSGFIVSGTLAEIFGAP